MQVNHELIVEPIGLDVEKLPRPLNFAELFGNDHPVEIEIGIGKGTFITEQAKARPDVNFLGIEWARWFWRYSSDRLRRNKCENARTVRAEATYFLTEFVPTESISVLHIYFPDPWPKKRHHKRRLVQEPFGRLGSQLRRRALRPVARADPEHESGDRDDIETLAKHVEPRAACSARFVLTSGNANTLGLPLIRWRDTCGASSDRSSSSSPHC